MAKLNSNDYVMFIDDTTSTSASAGAAYEVVACLTNISFSGTTNVIEVNDRCGNEALPGNQTNTFTATGNATDGVGMSSPVSYQKLMSLYQSKDKFWVKLAKSTDADPTAPLLMREAVGFITDYSETGDQDSPYTFSLTVRVDGDINTSQTT